MFAAAVKEWASPAIHSSYCSATFALKGLFQTTSGASMYFVQPPRMIKDMYLACVALVWLFPSRDTHAKIRRVNEKFPKTPPAQSKVSSSFIHPLEDDATTHLALNSSLTNLVSFLAPGKTVKGFHFVQSAFAVRKTETFVFSWPVVLMANVLWPMESTVVLESMSYKTTVSSIAITSLSV